MTVCTRHLISGESGDECGTFVPEGDFPIGVDEVDALVERIQHLPVNLQVHHLSVVSISRSDLHLTVILYDKQFTLFK